MKNLEKDLSVTNLEKDLSVTNLEKDLLQRACQEKPVYRKAL